MKRLVFMVFILLLNSVNAQDEKEIKIFHRLVILNSSNELMVVKVKNADVWVTPGIYQTQDLTIKKGLTDLALTYGIEIDELKLKGVFILKRELDNDHSTSLRNVFIGYSKSNNFIIPTGIEEVKWVSIDEANQLITFPHISVMIEQILNEPNAVLGGTLLQFKENDIWKTKIIEEFYSFGGRKK